MFWFLIKRVWNNKWLFICLLIGAISTTAVVGAIPMYVDGIFQKVLSNDLHNKLVYESQSPTRLTLLHNGDLKYEEDLLEGLQKTENVFKEIAGGDYAMDIVMSVGQERLNKLSVRLKDGQEIDGEKKVFPTRLKGYEDKVVWRNGRPPENADNESSVLEVAVSERALSQLKLTYQKQYTLLKEAPFNKGETKVTDFKIVGVFTIEDENSLFWSEGRYHDLTESILFQWDDFDLLMADGKPVVLYDQELTTFFDYEDLKIYELEDLVKQYNTDMAYMKAQGNQFYLQLPVMGMLEAYQQRRKSLKTTLWIVMIPLLMIIGFYALLVSNLIIRQDRNEIAVLKSRGAGRRQIFMLYVMETVLIGLIAMGVGPFISKSLCTLLSASNGFLEFVQRPPMMMHMSMQVYIYSAVGMLVYGICILIPVISASRMHIVMYKKSLLGDHKKAFWHRGFLDVILMGIALYGLYVFNSRQDVLMNTGARADQMTIDPLLFIISTLFIVGGSIFFLRLYPFLIKLIFKAFEKHWHPVAYFSMVNVAEGNKHLQAIMLFLILSISFGLMSANQARTINQNAIDRVNYTQGADIIIEPYNNLLHQGIPPRLPEGVPEEDSNVTQNKVAYEEPPYPLYQQIKGVRQMTKVYRSNDVVLTGKKRVTDVEVMGIRTHEFGEITWFRDDLLPHHIYEYLNLLAAAPKAVLVSSNFKDLGYEIGDEIELMLPYQGDLEGMIYGFFQYFPTYTPFNEEGRSAYLTVVNDYYMDSRLPLRPYELWINKDDHVTDTMIYDQIMEKELELESISFRTQKLIGVKNDPLLLGMNGSLTMCFMVEMTISAIGFIIFWLLSIQERKLKFGIFRAIGMPMYQVNGIMVMEQVLVSGMAVVIGFVLGSWASELFVPLLEVLNGAREQIPPFVVVSDRRDYVKVLIASGTTLVIALALLFYQIKKINVNQIIKLGEDS